jgi:hypothetical protein
MEVVVQAVTAAIALAALVVSIVVARRQTGVQERLAAVEEARRADEVAAQGRVQVTASVRGSMETWLMLRNDGPAVARQVLVEPDKRPGGPQPLGLELLPVDLQPHQEMQFRLPLGLRDEPVLRLTVQWTDEVGDHAEPYTLPIP